MRKRTPSTKRPLYIQITLITAVVILATAALFIIKYKPDFLFKSAVDTRGNSPALYWKFNEATGTTINDTSGNSKTGTATSITWRNSDSCVAGSCIYFNGTTSKIARTYSSDTSLDPSTSAFTISAWIKHPTAISGNQYVIARYVAGGYKVYMTSTGTVCFDIDSDGTFGGTQYDTACSTTTYNDNKWHFIEAVRNASDITLYVDNRKAAQDASLAASGSLSGTTPTLNVGVNSDGTTLFWNGFIDDVKYFAYARSSAQRQADMNSQNSAIGTSAGVRASPLLNNNLVGYWALDEFAANSCTGGANDNCDSTGNGNDGAWNGNATSTATADTIAKYGQGVAYDGTGDYVEVANSTSISPTTAITFSGWFDLRSASTTKALIVKNNAYRMVTDASSHPVCQISNGTTWQTAATSSFTYSLATYAHVACVYDGTTLTVYVNGVNTGTSTFTSAIGSNANPLRFGSDASATYGDLNGRSDDIRIYNIALTSGQILGIYRWAPPPAGYWKFDEGTGTATVDSSGNGNDGTLTNGPLWIKGKAGNGVDFDASNDYISAGISNSLSTANNMTISAWIYPQGYGHNNFGAIMYRFGGGGGTGGYEFETLNDGVNGTNTFCLWDTNVAYCAANNSITLNTWQFVSVVIDNNTIRLYVNGINVNNQAGTKSGTANLTNTGGKTAWIGGDDSATDIFDGYIDELKFYNYARTPAQVIEDMNLGKPVGTVGANISPVGTAVGYWKLNEGQGTTANNAGSGTSLNGTLTTMANPATSTSGWTEAGKSGNALLFDGTSDYVSIGNQTDATLRTDVTLSAWIKLTNTSSAHTIISKEGASGQFAYELYTDTNGKLNFDVSVDGTAKTLVTGTSTLATGTWYHVSGVYSPSTSLTVYVNAKKDGENTTSIPASIFNGTGGLQIGAANAGTLMTGTIDEVKLYAAALNSNQISLDYNFGKSQVLGSISTLTDGKTPSFGRDAEYCVPGDTTSCATPVIEYKLDENTGTSANDTSGNNNTGTLTNGPLWFPGKYGRGVRLDGTNDAITTTYDLDTTAPWSISFWVYPVSLSTDDTFVSEFNSEFAIYYNASGQIEVCNDLICADTATSTASQLTLNAWNNIEVTYSGTPSSANQLLIYVNGVNVTSDGQVLEAGAGANLTFGAFDGSPAYIQSIDGTMDQIRVFTYARTPAQVAWDYNRGGPVAWYKLNECTGSTVNDSSGKVNTGSITIGGGGSQTTVGTCSTSGAWFNGTAGKFGSSLNLDGDDAIEVPDSTALDIPSSFTVAAWVKPSSFAGAGNYSSVVVKDPDGTTGNYMMQLKNNQLDCSFGTFEHIPTTILSTGTWYNLACVFDDTNNLMTAYINGVPVLSEGETHTPTTNAGALEIGQTFIGSGSEFLSGQIDDVRVYNYNLSSIQMKTILNEGVAVHY